ncbi:hypothetical protein N9A28_04295 [Sulfurimonas sp.]|nr:hypothetical protein [Sulfurimonas sp.]
MAINYDNKTAKFESVIYEDDVVELRDFLQGNAGDEVLFDFSECEDAHLAILQLVMAYKQNYECSYQFSDNKKIFQILLEGFDTSENHCNQ